MKGSTSNTWNLESFLDSLIYELDKAQDTLSVKGINRKLTYTVKDVSLDLHVFPEYRNDTIMFSTARPGDTGASKLSLQLGSISDRQIRETTKQPADKDDITIDFIDEIEPEIKESLRKVGVSTADDLERIQKRNVDIRKVVKEKTGKDTTIDYGVLAGLINKSRRRTIAPSVSRISEEKSQTGKARFIVHGKNLFVARNLSMNKYPIAKMNNNSVDIVNATPDTITLEVPYAVAQNSENELVIAMDPYAVVQMKVQTEVGNVNQNLERERR